MSTVESTVNADAATASSSPGSRSRALGLPLPHGRPGNARDAAELAKVVELPRRVAGDGPD